MQALYHHRKEAPKPRKLFPGAQPRSPASLTIHEWQHGFLDSILTPFLVFQADRIQGKDNLIDIPPRQWYWVRVQPARYLYARKRKRKNASHCRYKSPAPTDVAKRTQQVAGDCVGRRLVGDLQV